MMIEDCNFWIIGRTITVELLPVEIPLDSVKVVALHIVVATEDSLRSIS